MQVHERILEEFNASNNEEFVEAISQRALVDSVQPVYCNDCGNHECDAEPDAQGFTCSSCGSKDLYTLEQFMWSM